MTSQRKYRLDKEHFLYMLLTEMYLKSYQFDQTLRRCREKVVFKKQQKTSDEPKQSLQSHAACDMLNMM